MHQFTSEYSQNLESLRSLNFSNMQIGKVSFCEPVSLKESEIIVQQDDKYYEIPVFDLINDSEDYDPKGLFCYIPTESAYATWDADHLKCIVFYGVNLVQIIQNYKLYFDAQWTGIVGQDVKNLSKYKKIDNPFNF